MPNAQQLPLSLYIHIPWCVRKCPYCDFNSHESHAIPEEAYTQALLQNLLEQIPMAQNRALTSIFIGGGTPSLFSAPSLAKVLQLAEDAIGFEPDIEITMEANPGRAEYQRLAQYRDAGINRLSFGVQSFNDQHLQALGRIHNASEAQTAFSAARDAGFTNINVDLMHGLPNQLTQQALTDLEIAIELGPEHLSWYQLTIEPNTVFYNNPPRLPDEDRCARIQTLGQEVLEKAGYAQYEVSAYSKSAHNSKHNRNYWEFGDYLAIGAGAHGKISCDDDRILRFQQTRLPKNYLDSNKPFTASSHHIPLNEQALEFMMNALRLKDGVLPELLEQRTQLTLQDIHTNIHKAQQRGLLDSSPSRLRCSPQGFLFLNETLKAFS